MSNPTKEEKNRIFYKDVQEIKLTTEAFILLFRYYCAERGLSVDSLQTMDNKIIDALRIEALEIKEESEQVAEKLGVTERDAYDFRLNWIKNYKPKKTY